MRIEDTRLKSLNSVEDGDSGDYILYWMQASQRLRWNQAFEFAKKLSSEKSKPLIVVFGLTDDYPEANQRHYTFMLQGLQEIEADLKKKGILFRIYKGEPHEAPLLLADRASVIVCDRGYLRHEKKWRAELSKKCSCPLIQVECNVVVPLEEVSHKREFAARTIRPKIKKKLNTYMKKWTSKNYDAKKLKKPKVKKSDINLSHSINTLLEELQLDRSVKPVKRLKGGENQAQTHMKKFFTHKLNGYASGRSEPGAFHVSYFSAYLHFGQVSPLELAWRCEQESKIKRDDKDTFLEELIIRRELAMNFVHFEPDYDQYKALPSWAQKSLNEKRKDKRPYLYTKDELEAAGTHDEYWNTAMREMRETGYMHNYMRMYWGKKILEWSETPEEAFKTTLELNNKYFMDGRDPNSFTGVAWCFGLHDRPWTEREVFGKIRYMNDKGLKRKFDIELYQKKVEELVTREGPRSG
jgi:deoxyribodipyrimidine photo-lyase